MYGVTAMVFFVVGGLEASLIRAQLAQADGTILSADKYNQMFTMHATTMVFLFVMPMAAAFANYMIPLQIGARDVAFPRLNALSFWTFLFGGIFINTSWFLGGGADGGWFMYAPNSSTPFSPSDGVNFWTLGLLITGVASLVGAVNLIVTVLNMRAPGMTMMRMPIFTWMGLVTQFLLLFAMPVITVALFLLLFQRNYGATFFSVADGADPLLWQHLFWIFGHPEVYIIVLPAFGIVSEVLPVFSRKPLFGYPFVVFSGAAIGFLGWGVWAHHMFASGLGPISVSVFAVATMAIAIPTGVKIVNWTLTMWGGKLYFSTAMLFAIGLIIEFTIGGLSGVTHAVAPSDTQQTDTYYIVAHFHYVIFGGGVLGLFAGMYYWWPKIFGKMLSEKIGKWNFWLMIIGMNMTFGPMHILGLQGQPRRMYIWTEERSGEGFFNLGFWNLVSSIGTVVLGVRRVHVLLRQRVGDPQGPAGARRSVGRPQPRMDHVEPAEGVQLRAHPDRALARRVLPSQVRRRRHRRPPRVQEGGHRRGGRRRGGRARRCPHPPAVAVVLADHAGAGAADHGLRRHLSHVADRRRRGVARRFDLRLGARTVDRPRLRLRSAGRWRRDEQGARGPCLTPSPIRTRATVALPPKRWTKRSTAPRSSTRSSPRNPTAAGPTTSLDHIGLAHHTSTGLSNTKLAMWLFLGSECLCSVA